MRRLWVARRRLSRRTALASSDASAADAAVVIEILDERNERRSASVGGQSRAAEYEMTYAVQYRLLGSDERELAPATWVQRDRVYRIDRGNIVGSSGEQNILRTEMIQDVVGQIIRAVDAVSRTLGESPENVGAT